MEKKKADSQYYDIAPDEILEDLFGANPNWRDELKYYKYLIEIEKIVPNDFLSGARKEESDVDRENFYEKVQDIADIFKTDADIERFQAYYTLYKEAMQHPTPASPAVIDTMIGNLEKIDVPKDLFEDDTLKDIIHSFKGIRDIKALLKIKEK